MDRRSALGRAAASALLLSASAVTSACGAGSGDSGSWLERGAKIGAAGIRRIGAASNAEASRALQARQIALSLADLPAGYRLAEELAPSFDSEHVQQDPWGRLSAYSATFVPGAAAPGQLGDVVSSVNAYAESKVASAAFASWRSALPSAYRPAAVDANALGDEAAVLVQAPAAARGRVTCLVGLRRRNVMASVSVAVSSTGEPPVAQAIELAKLTLKRIEATRP